MKSDSRHIVNNTPQQLAENASRWVTSPEGQQAIAASLKQAQSLTTQFQEAQRVDPERLHKPVTL